MGHQLARRCDFSLLQEPATTDDARVSGVVRSAASPGQQPCLHHESCVEKRSPNKAVSTVVIPSRARREPYGPFQPATHPLRCDCCPGPWQRPFFSAQLSREELLTSKAPEHSIPCGVAASLQLHGVPVRNSAAGGPARHLLDRGAPLLGSPVRRRLAAKESALLRTVKLSMPPVMGHTRTTRPCHGWGPMVMTSDPMHAVEVAALIDAPSDFEHVHAAPELQTAVAWAVTHGMPIKDVATAARMTALEVLDAADSLNYRRVNSSPPASGQPETR